MVHKTYKWNIYEEKIRKIIFNLINNILTERKNKEIEYDELYFLLNNRTKTMNLTNNNKKKSITNYIKNVFGSLVNFIDDYENFMLVNKQKNVFVKLNCIDLSDWIILDDSDDEYENKDENKDENKHEK